MMNRILNRLSVWANRWVILSLVAIVILINAVILPAVQRSMVESSGGAGPLDLRFGFSAAEAFAAVESYGQQGRSVYALVESTVDVIYPIAYGLLFALLVRWLYIRAFPAHSRLQYLALLPFVVMGCDFLENVGIVTLLLSYPTQSTLISGWASLFGMLKWAFLGVTVLALLVGLVSWLLHRR